MPCPPSLPPWHTRRQGRRTAPPRPAASHPAPGSEGAVPAARGQPSVTSRASDPRPPRRARAPERPERDRAARRKERGGCRPVGASSRLAAPRTPLCRVASWLPWAAGTALGQRKTAVGHRWASVRWPGLSGRRDSEIPREGQRKGKRGNHLRARASAHALRSFVVPLSGGPVARAADRRVSAHS